MARIKLEDDFKKAITGLSHKQKDRLLFRLIAKDKALVAKLHFELIEVEQGVTKEDRRAVIEEDLIDALKSYKKHYYSPGYLLINIRHLSGEINRHVKATSDKYGDVYLNFLMLNHSFRLFADQLRKSSPARSNTFDKYVVKRALRLMNQLVKMHEDHVLDFEEPMKELGNHIGDQPNTMNVAIDLGLDVNYLLRGELIGNK